MEIAGKTEFHAFLLGIIIFFCGTAGLQAAEQSSTNYTIGSDVVSGGGGDAASTNYGIEHTTGQSAAIGESASASYANFAGFWYTVGEASDGDADADGIPDGDGTNPCTGGNTADCDDNCVMTANPDQADADSDGVGDVCDNCREVANADQLDSNSGEDDNSAVEGIQHYGDVCDPDFNNDGLVYIQDFNEWRMYYGQQVPTAPAYLDINGDGLIYIQDFNIWRQYYGEAPGPGIDG